MRLQHLVLLAATVCLSLNSLAFADGPKVETASGYLPRNLSLGYVDIAVSVSNVLASDASASSDVYFERLKLFAVKIDDDSEIPHNAIGTSTIGLYVKLISATVGADTVTGNKVIAYKLRIFAVDATNGLQSWLDKEGSSTQVTLNIEYHGGSTDKSDLDNDMTIKRATGVANEAPGGISVSANNRSLVAEFTYDATIDITGDASSTSGESTGATMYVLPNSSGRTIPAKIFNSDPAKETAINCQFTPVDGVEGSCISCGDGGANTGKAYFDPAQLDGVSDLKYVTVADGRAEIAGLDPDTSYAVFMSYQPDGVVYSSCYIGQPIIDYSLSERYGESDAEMKDPRCFIATAAYGRADDPQVLALRWFRGHVLLTLPFGKQLVRAYYRTSPPIAALVAKSPWLRFAVRTALWPVTTLAQFMRWLSGASSTQAAEHVGG